MLIFKWHLTRAFCDDVQHFYVTCFDVYIAFSIYDAVLWISGCPVAKYDPLRGRAIQLDPQVAQWATQLWMIGGKMVKRKTCKFCVLKIRQIIWAIKKWFGQLRFPPWVVRWATHEFGLIHSTDDAYPQIQYGHSLLFILIFGHHDQHIMWKRCLMHVFYIFWNYSYLRTINCN